MQVCHFNISTDNNEDSNTPTPPSVDSWGGDGATVPLSSQECQKDEGIKNSYNEEGIQFDRENLKYKYFSDKNNYHAKDDYQCKDNYRAKNDYQGRN